MPGRYPGRVIEVRNPAAVSPANKINSEVVGQMIDRGMAERHYAEHSDKPFFGDLVDFITGGEVVVARLTGREAVAVLRALMGATDPAKSPLGTIRGDLGIEITENLVHGSDSEESAQRELALFFPQ